ncbi:hypothetical protein SE17_36175 [Kouleothrix aurantiaca]|jgi:DNA-binding NtrC family response regulator|uniref:Response regulatory domain-containing protein n=1 Tax=Kouleothrix aurantiaca TaxID=186479 RepID=A0A0P9DFI1_9CHLR|nr:hypothetical protein SE17_36175 [Kouleothrix aurantiaca]
MAQPNLVIVIDDEDAVRSVTGRMLERVGFRAKTAGNGLEGISLFSAHAEDVLCVLVDQNMPHMSGEATVRELRALRPDARVVLMSGQSSEDITEQYQTLQLTGFLQKPFNLTDLRATVESIAQSLV